MRVMLLHFLNTVLAPVLSTKQLVRLKSLQQARTSRSLQYVVQSASRRFFNVLIFSAPYHFQKKVRTQATRALSATDAGFHALIATAIEARGAESLLTELNGTRPPVVVECDNSTAIKKVERRGVGRMGHKDAFARRRNHFLQSRQVSTELTSADIGTQYVTRTSIDNLMNLMTARPHGKGELGAIGSEELDPCASARL